MKTQHTYDVRMPDYALPYLINCDDSGLNFDDIQAIDRYMAPFYKTACDYKMGDVIVSPTDENPEPYFTWNPAFGLACDVIDCTIVILSE